jgi:hypothetical protein
MFYRRNEERLEQANDIYAPKYQLLADNHADYEYPTEDGWYWFDTLDKALEKLPRVDKPTEVSMRQARLALLQSGLLSDVEAFVDSLGEAAQVEFEYATSIRRDHPLVVALPWSDEQKDVLFAAAAAID